MKLNVTKTEVWAGEINDEPGGLAGALKALADCGADLDCVIARRMPDKPGKGVLFVTPVKGKRTLDKAKEAGFQPTHQVTTLKVEGANGKGVGARIAAAIGKAGVSMRGLSGVVIGKKFVCYIGFDNPEALAKAKKALAAVK